MGGRILNFSIFTFRGQEGQEAPSGTGRRRGRRAVHVRALPQGPLVPPAPRGPHVEPRGARAGRNRARRAAQAVPGGEANPTKMSDVHAEHAMGASMDPTGPWGTLGAHVVAAKGARKVRVGGGV